MIPDLPLTPDQLIRFTFPLVVMTAALTVGYLVKLRQSDATALSRKLTRIGLIWLDPMNIVLALWSQSFASPRILLLPLIGTALTLLSAAPVALVARMRGTPRDRAGSMVGTSMFSNQGPTFGTFLAFVLAGEAGFATATMYTLYFYPLFFTFGLLVGRHYSSAGSASAGRLFLENMRDPASRNCLIAVAAGILLSLSGPGRPAAFEYVPDYLVPVTTFVYLAAIGMTLNFSRIRAFLKHTAAIGVIKFAITPALGLLVIWLMRPLGLLDALSAQVVFIQACMPAAIFALVLVNLFDLERDLANTVWLLTNGAGIMLSPLILVLAGRV